MDCGKKWLFDFNAEKTQLVSFDWPNNNGSIDVRMNGPVLNEKSTFNPIQGGGGGGGGGRGGAESPTITSVSPVTSTNLGSSPKSF